MAQLSTQPEIYYPDELWIGLKIHVEAPNGTTLEWTLEQKNYEKMRETELYGIEARAVFGCSGAEDKKCVVKISMLLSIPEEIYFIMTPATAEMDMLHRLSNSRCQATPSYIGSMECLQSFHDPRPGVLTSFIAMEKVPGRVYSWNEFWHGTTFEERILKRAAFKEAFDECMRCGYWNLDAGLRNLIFDDTNGKCYIIDWESPIVASEVEWTETMYGMWELVQYDRSIPEDFLSWIW